MSTGLKLGTVPYLNAEPLIWPFDHEVIEHPHTIIRATPSELVRMLVDGEVDCALAPVVCLLEHPDLIPIPNVAIACRGAVASVLLFHNNSFETLETIWLDPASRTSNLLVQVLRNQSSEKPCKYIIPDDNDAPPVDQLPDLTGRLLIGDPAISQSQQITSPTVFDDLGELWREKTNHPFTFARWIAKDGDTAALLREPVCNARDWSLLNLHELIEPLSKIYGFSPDLVDRYLRINITYMHGPREQAGQREFFIQAKKFLRERDKNHDA